MTTPDTITITLPDGATITLTTTTNDGASDTRIVVTSKRAAVKADEVMDRDSLIALSYAIIETMNQRATTRRENRTE
jgi:hypothetical protein